MSIAESGIPAPSGRGDFKVENDKELRALVREFFGILEQEETSDMGRDFHPTTIQSCRCMVTARLNDLLPRMKELAQKG